MVGGRAVLMPPACVGLLAELRRGL